MIFMEIKAKAKYIKMSPKKVRLVVDAIRNMGAEQALVQLRFINKKAAKPVAKLLNSAIANAFHNFEIEKQGLHIKEMRVDQASTLKRWKPRAFGRAGMIRKKSSHISIILEGEKTVKTAKKKDIEAPKIVNGISKSEVKKSKAKDAKKIKPETKEQGKEIFDERMAGKHRHKAHLDTIKKKDKSGFMKTIFRRKSD